ncbi:MAG: glycoside hydrolase, partial [Meiothermus sp.]
SVPATQNLARHLAARFPKLLLAAYARENPESELPELKKKVAEADFLLLATTARRPLTEAEIGFAQSLFSLGKPALHLAIWNPYHVMTLRQPAFITYGFREPSLLALAQNLAGEPAPGALPVEH